MPASLNQPKRLYWYIVLGTIVPWTCFSTSPPSMDSKTIALSAFSAPQHVHGIDQSDAQMRRYLRSNSNMLEHLDRDTEDRGPPMLSEAVGTMVDSGAQTMYKYMREMASSITKIAIDRHFVDSVLNKIKIDKATGDLFKSEQYNTWATSVNYMYRSNPGAARGAKISTLLSTLGKDAVLSILAAGKNDRATKAIAEDLEIGLVIWLAADVNVVSKLLKFGKVGTEEHTSKLLKTWIYHARHRLNEKEFEKLFAQLASHFNNGNLVQLLAVAKKKPESAKVAMKLEKHQLKVWQRSEIDSAVVFKLLKLNEEGPSTLLTSPVLRTWISYVIILGKDPYRILLSKIESMGDSVLVRIFARAKSDGTNKDIVETMEYVHKLHVHQPQVFEWWKARKSGEDVFLLLGLQKEGERMFESPRWDTWVSYVTFRGDLESQRERIPAVQQTFSMLKNRFGEEGFAKLVAKAKTVEKTKEFAAQWERRLWRFTGQTPDEVFDLLKLKEKGSAVFASPEFTSWVTYVEELNQIKRNPKMFPAVQELSKHYGPGLMDMLTQSRITAMMKGDEHTYQTVDEMIAVLHKYAA